MKKTILTIPLLVLAGYTLISASPEDLPSLSGQPSWFPLGEEVYHERSRFDAHKELLDLIPEPRWFKGFPKAVSQEEFEKWQSTREERGAFAQSSNDFSDEDQFQIPSRPPYPKTINSLPRKDQGTTLDLSIANGDTPKELLLTLTLKAEKRTVRREVEHRWTNTTPFLFALFADGEAISREIEGFSKSGGANHLVDVVEAGEQDDWKLKMSAKSIDTLVGPNAQEVTILAAFSERQHEGFFPGDMQMELDGIWDLNKVAPQILVRSNLVRLMRVKEGWAVAPHR